METPSSCSHDFTRLTQGCLFSFHLPCTYRTDPVPDPSIPSLHPPAHRLELPSFWTRLDLPRHRAYHLGELNNQIRNSSKQVDSRSLEIASRG